MFVIQLVIMIGGYRKAWAYLFIILSTICIGIFVAAYFMKVQVNILNYIPALMCMLLGFSYLQKKYFSIKGNTFTIYSLFGSAHKTYRFKEFSDIIIDGDKIFISADGKKTRVRINKSMTDKDDWAQLMRLIRKENIGSQLHG